MSTHARVKVTLDIEVSSSWGNDCALEQIHKQAAEEALGSLNRALSGDRIRASIVGRPSVTAIIVAEE